MQLGGLLTAELSKLGLTSAELLLGLHSEYEVAWLDTDLRKPIEAEGFLIWSGAPMLTVEHIAAALETAWQMSLVSMSKEDLTHCEKLSGLCYLEPSAFSPHRLITELSMAQQIMAACVDSVERFCNSNEEPDEGDTACTQIKIFMLSTGSKQWTPLNIKNHHEDPDHITYSSNVEIDKSMAYAVLGSTFNLNFMRGYVSSLGYHCYNNLMGEVDPNRSRWLCTWHVRSWALATICGL